MRLALLFVFLLVVTSYAQNDPDKGKKYDKGKQASEIECPMIDGWTFYPLQEAISIVIRAAANGGYHDSNNTTAVIANRIAVQCNNAAQGSLGDTALLCNAFSTLTGELLLVPAKPRWTKLDFSTDSDVYPCDGTYVRDGRNAFGFDWSAAGGETPASLESKGRAADLKHQSVMRAAAKIKQQLMSAGKNPKNASARDLRAAASAAQVPLATDADYTAVQLQTAISAASCINCDQATNSSAYPYISAVRNQGSCGSCVAFAVTAAAEAALGRALQNSSNTHNLAEQWMFFCNNMYAPSCATGWWPPQASQVLVASGLPYENCYPYLAAPGCTANSVCSGHVNTVWKGTFQQVAFSSTQMVEAKAFLEAGGVISTFFDVYNDFYYINRTSGVYRYDGVSAYVGGHAVLVIGYNDVAGYWTVKNSWGSGWGEYGYYRVYYGQGGFMSGSNGNMIGIKFNLATPLPTTAPVTAAPTTAPVTAAPTTAPVTAAPTTAPTTAAPTTVPATTAPTTAPVTPAPTLAPIVCGNGRCEAGETCSNCAADCLPCITCGDNICNGGETCTTCPDDCGACVCGDGRCNSPIETTANCPGDCPAPKICGDGICNLRGGESCFTCPSDCGKCAKFQTTCTSTGVCCGNLKCESTRGYRESITKCPGDCGGVAGAPDSFSPVVTGACGDDICSNTESRDSCPRDCAGRALPRWMLGKIGTGTKLSKRSCAKGKDLDCPSANIRPTVAPAPTKRPPPKRKVNRPPPTRLASAPPPKRLSI